MNLLLLATVASLCALGSFAKANECSAQQFVYFIRKYNKEYSSPAEYFSRMKAYLRNCREIYEHNERYKKGLETFEMEINQFADSYEDERYFTGELPTDDPEEFETLPYHFSRNIDVPKEVDWRSKGVVTRVKNQGPCGSCWAFGATAVVESQYVLQTRNKLTVLSEQSLLDCETSSSGCSGGSTWNAVKFVMKHGIARDDDYPYTHVKGKCQCKEKSCSDHPEILKVLRLRSNSEEELKMVVAFLGPVAFNFDGAVASFQQYKKGVYSASDCRGNTKNHSMAIVGYGTENGQDYWLVKNSWGPYWGDKGYVKIARNKNNFCGIAINVFLPMYKTRRPW
ncbi:procathepsin L-like [Cloeon dipterum]|uniref:procathepsin L-like n=1 Tax=Cloeon dipterum TaxID=197152 RepID=UPI00321FBBCF